MVDSVTTRLGQGGNQTQNLRQLEAQLPGSINPYSDKQSGTDISKHIQSPSK